MRIVIVAVFIVAVIYIIIQNKRQTEARMTKKLLENWGKKPKKQISRDQFDMISHYFRNGNQENVIDDITWNDLNMDEVFRNINNTNSSVGQEYLYKMLRHPLKEKSKLDEIDRLAAFFDGHEKERFSVQKEFYKMGYARHISVSDYIDALMEQETRSNFAHYITWIFLVLSLAVCIFVNPVIGIWAVIAAIAFSVISYYKYKAKVEHYFICVNQIIRMVMAAENIKNLSIQELEVYNESFDTLIKAFSKVTKNAWLLETGTISGSLAEIMLEYIRIITHVDLIKFNHILKALKSRREDVHELMDTLGFIESTIAIASFRRMLPYWSIPKLMEEHGGHCCMDIEDAFHPLIDKPVANSINVRKHVLLTGSNASGKSTFLKTIAINAILAQTIHTSVSKSYRAPVYRIYSSMALKDDLGNADSYYIVEIKSLKRIIDAVNQSGNPVLCFIDEVLRGTNTVERIAASSEILKGISNRRALCFAATHDVELTSILASEYENYHFQEEVVKKDVRFNFQLFKGPATTRNAIKLLDMIGYNPSIISGAERRAAYFLDKGIWEY